VSNGAICVVFSFIEQINFSPGWTAKGKKVDSGKMKRSKEERG
jgi:hypothetical protein